MKRKIVLVAAMLMGLFATSSFAQLKINGAGATFPYVIYSKWFDVYHQKTGI
jgi:phosphate transport system substrate-binding protein